MSGTPETLKLRFRPLAESDRDNCAALFMDADVMRYAWMQVVEERSAYDRFFNHLMARAQSGVGPAFATELEEGDGVFRFVGLAELDLVERAPGVVCAEIGYFLVPSFWGRGFASRMAEFLVRHAFDVLSVARVQACCNAGNAASERVMLKCGLRFVGRLAGQRWKNGVWQDELHYAVLREDWGSAHGRKWSG